MNADTDQVFDKIDKLINIIEIDKEINNAKDILIEQYIKKIKEQELLIKVLNKTK